MKSLLADPAGHECINRVIFCRKVSAVYRGAGTEWPGCSLPAPGFSSPRRPGISARGSPWPRRHPAETLPAFPTPPAPGERAARRRASASAGGALAAPAPTAAPSAPNRRSCRPRAPASAADPSGPRHLLGRRRATRSVRLPHPPATRGGRPPARAGALPPRWPAADRRGCGRGEKS